MNRAGYLAVIFALVVVTNLGAFISGFAAGHTVGASNLLVQIGLLPSPRGEAARTPADLADTFRPFWQAWDLLQANYAVQPLDEAVLMRGAIRGLLQAVDDPHTGYMTPDEFRISMTGLDGELEGIGATVETDPGTGYTRIVAPLSGSPAEQAGLRTGDLIVTIDGEDIAGQDITTVVTKVRGPAGSQVTLEIVRGQEPEPRAVTVTRAKITIPSVESELLADGLGYVRINNFGEKTAADLRTQLRDLMAQNPRGLVLDLRGNPGGYLDTAVDVASQFLPDGVVLVEKFGDGRETSYSVQPGGLATQLPLVVLIDEGSASASEIVAGAIQDHGRGQVVGAISYGKGSVQKVLPLNGDGAVRITVARWLTPNGAWINEVGVTPDVLVERTDADRTAGRDPQLDRALELLK